MKLLLDTHIWIWALIEPERLTRRVSALLEDPAHELWLSPISMWETSLLIERNRISVEGTPERWIDAALREFPVRDAVLTREVALSSRRVDLPHRDPADRFIAASAIVYELALVTADVRLLATKQWATVSN